MIGVYGFRAYAQEAHPGMTACYSFTAPVIADT
jgi:hypothetical protein